MIYKHFDMRNILLILCACMLLACGKQAEKVAKIKVCVDNPTSTFVALVHDRTVREIPLDSTGCVEITDTVPGFRYARLYYGADFKHLFLEGGEQLDIRFDGNRFREQIHVEGRNASVVDYLNAVRPAGDELTNYGIPFADYLRAVERKTDDALALLDARKLGKVNPRFEKIERERLRYFFAQSLLMYPLGHAMQTQDSLYTPGDDYYQALESYVVEKEDMGQVNEYREFVKEAAAALARHAGTPAVGFYQKMLAAMRYVGKRFSDNLLRQQLIAAYAAEYVDFYGIRNLEEMESVVNAYVTDPSAMAIFRTSYDKWDLTSPGRPSPDFRAEDVEGKVHTLADFRGKYVYIDLWATWCKPCKEELPHLKELEKKFEGRNITFLGLSIDGNRAAWETRVKSGELAGVQLFLGRRSDFQQAYRIEGIPRFILLNPEGKIVNNDMLRPSSPDIERMLNTLPGM